MLRRLLDTTYIVAAVLAAGCLAGIALLILAQVIGRWFGILVPAAEEFAGFLLAAATFLALAYTQHSGGNIRVTLAIRHFAPRARRWQEALVLLLTLLLACALVWSAFELVLESYEFGDVSSGHVAVPLWIPQMPMAAGLGVYVVALADELVSVLTGKQPPYADAETGLLE